MDRENRKVSRRFVYHGFGFPVTLLNVPMARLRGAWTPDVNYEHLERAILLALAGKGARLSGREVRFIRLAFELTLQEFARRFGVTHPAVLKWEKTAARTAGMGWSTEKDIRLFVRSRLERQPGKFVKAYRELETQPASRATSLVLDAASVA
jgi:hypothetical protein